MNKLKVRSPSGMVSYINLQQKAPKRGYRFEVWNSAATAKARVLAMGATLLGVRQK